MRYIPVSRSRAGRPLDFARCAEAASPVLAREGVVLAYVFGSYARDAAGTLSDVDVAVLYGREVGEWDRFQSCLRLTTALIPVFEDEAVDLVDLTKAPPLLRYKVAGEGRVLYDPGGRHVEFLSQAMVRYLDFKPFQDRQFADMHRRLREGTYGVRQ